MLKELKEYLNITWDDFDSKLQNSIDASIEYLNYVSGTTLDFESSSFNKSLLFNRCRYDYNNALEYFEVNFQRELTQLQIMNSGDKNV
ncbi:hypothetical protein [Clostridium chrysemydis]|uniref:hypothetical protein n=1 Tax=Clostridium chrysemydis TaxID=2665504 RepID=UPI003F2E1741